MSNYRFPPELIALPQWVCWRMMPDPKGGKDRKVPYDPATSLRASSTNPKTWSTFEAALSACEEYIYSGLGFVFTRESGLVGIDIDHCRDPSTGSLNDTAAAILGRLSGTYAEISPSGTGVHLFLYGEIPGKGNKNTGSGVEMYAHSRYFTMTGNPLESAPAAIARDDAALKWIFETYIKPPRMARRKKNRAAPPGSLSDDDVPDKARSAKNGDAFAALWAGQWQDSYASQSEADLSLCCSLAFWTGKDKEQMDRLFRQSGLYRPKWDTVHHAGGATYGEETLARAMDLAEDVYSPDADNTIFERGGRYYRAKGDNVYPITNFVCVPHEMIVSEDETQMAVDLVTTHHETFRLTFMTTDFGNLQKFKNVLNKRTISLSYTGGEGDLELLKGYLAGLPWTVKHGVKALGIHLYGGCWVFVSPDGAMGSGGDNVLEDVVQLEKHQGIETGIQRRKAIDADGLMALGPSLLRYNESAKTVAVLAWCAGCFIKEHLRQAGIKFPHLFLIGEAGSGKSNTLERVILPVFSRTKVIAATQVTAFTLMKESASSNLIPQVLDEFKPSKIDRIRLNALYNHMRDTYDGHAGLRGRADQTAVSYALLAPLIIAGEESPDEAAIRERSMELLFSKRDLKDSACRAAFQQLTRMPDALAAFGRGLLDTALATPGADAVTWYDESLSLFSKELPTRIINNLACCMTGLRLAEKLCVSLELAWNDVFSFALNGCAVCLQYAAREYLLDGGETNKSVVEQTLEVMDRMGLDEEECRMLENGTQAAVHFKGVYDRYTKYRRDHAIVGECLTYAQFMRQLRKSELYVDERPVRFNSEVHWAVILNYATLRQRCDVTGFSSGGIKPLGSGTV
ncbi:MAG: DNA primase [Firmicutes bacterium]|nr:DNA primase [Bacillota bacterium]